MIFGMYLIGASGHAKVIIDILQEKNIRISGLYDKDESIKSLMGYKVFPKTHVKESDNLLISIGNNLIRQKLAQRFSRHNFSNAIHPQSVVSKSVKLGVGLVVMAGTVINADTVIGNHVIINTSASIDHDCVIKDYAHIAPNTTLCGGVKIGEATLIGAGATVIPNVKIGKNVIIGAGSIVIEDVPDNVMVAGNPARVIKKI